MKTLEREPQISELLRDEPVRRIARRMDVVCQLQGALAMFSLIAAVVHFGAMGVHANVSWQHAVFFACVAWFQLFFAAGVLLRPSKPVLIAGVGVNMGIIGVWAVSRTAGISIGSGSGIEPVGFPDVLATLLEGLIAAGAVVLLWTGSVRHPWTSWPVRVPMAAISVLLLPLATVAFTPAFASEGAGHDHGGATASAAHTHRAPAGVLTGDTPCEKAGPPASEGQVFGGHGHLGPIKQVPIDHVTELVLQQQQEQARQVALKYPTVADAERAGYKESTVYVPCIGAHYTNVAFAASFNPSTPAELLYDGTTPTSSILGLSYLVYHPGGPPEGFAGPNDRWHQHNFNGGLCIKGGLVIGAEKTSPSACKAMGGRKVPLDNIWMLHDWVVPGFECSWGVFAGECPELGGRAGATAWNK